MTLRLAIVADIHHGRPSTAKRGDRALPLMAEFAHFVRDAARPACARPGRPHLG
jgi:3',5'-cyclic-AMP phosphodiesterase